MKAAQAAGCRILCRYRWDDNRAWFVSCPSHGHKVRMLANLAELDARDPEVRDIATQIAADCPPDDLAIISAVHEFVRDGVHFMREPIETFTPTAETLDLGLGDCDDSARALMALLRALGYRAALRTLWDPPRHVACVFRMFGHWHWAESTIAAQLGEHPLAAKRRLQVEGRSDLG